MARQKRQRSAVADALGVALIVVGVVAFVGLPTGTDAQGWLGDHWLLVGFLGLAVLALLITVVSLFVRAKRRARALRRQVAVTDAMSGPEFEEFVARLLRTSGYSKVKVCGGAGDRGMDVCGYDPIGRWTVVQCKRWFKPIGSPEVQKFNGTAWTVHKAEVAVLITNSVFTDPARVEATSHGTVLVDRPALATWLALGQPPPALGLQRPRDKREVARASTDPRFRSASRSAADRPAPQTPSS